MLNVEPENFKKEYIDKLEKLADGSKTIQLFLYHVKALVREFYQKCNCEICVNSHRQ